MENRILSCLLEEIDEAVAVFDDKLGTLLMNAKFLDLLPASPAGDGLNALRDELAEEAWSELVAAVRELDGPRKKTMIKLAFRGNQPGPLALRLMLIPPDREDDARLILAIGEKAGGPSPSMTGSADEQKVLRSPLDLEKESRIADVRRLSEELSGISRRLADLSASLGSDQARISLKDYGLGPRHIEIARLIESGATTKAIARELGLAEATVKCHLSVIYRKTGVQGRTAFIHFLYGNGISLE